MADRFNIKFTIQAVDRFSATMKKLDRQLESIQRKADEFDINKDVQITADTATAMNEMKALQRTVDRLDRAAAKERKIQFKTTHATAELERMSSMIRGMSPSKIDIDANTRGAMTNLRRVDAFMGDIRDRNREIKVKMEMETGGAMRSLQRIATQTDRVMNARRNFEIGMNTLPATQALRELKAAADNTTRAREIDVGVDINEAVARMSALRAVAESLDDVDIDVDADVAPAVAQLTLIQRLRNRIGRPVVIDVMLGGYTKFRRNMDRIATTGRNVGEIVTNSFMGIATTFSTTLVPIIASTTGALGSLGVMVGTTAGATLGLTSSVVSAGSGFGLFALAGTEVIGTLFDIEANMKRGSKEWNALSQNTRDAVGVIGEFQYGYRSMMQSFREPITDMFIVFMQAVNGTLEHFKPIVAAAVGAMGNLVDSFAELTKSKDMHAWFTHLEQTVGPAMEAIGGAVMNFMMGFFNLMRAFGPLAVDMQNGLLAMSESFRAWSDGLNSSNGFQKFTDYVRTNWPVIKSIFADGIMGIVALFTAFAPYAEDWMARTRDMMATFRAFAENLGQNQQFQQFIDYIRANAPAVTSMIGDLVQFLVALGVALAPVGAAMVRVASAILNFMTSVLQANPELGHMLGWIVALGGGFFTLLPIGIALYSFFSTFVAVLRLVIPALMGIVKTVVGVFTSFTRLSSAFTTLRIVMMMLGGPIAWVIATLLLLIPVFMRLWQTSEQFRTTVTNAFNAVRAAIQTAISAISSYVMSVWGSLVAWWAANGEMIKQATSNVWNVIATVITTVMNAIFAVIKFIWPAVQMLIVSVWNNIKGVISGALNIIMGLVTAFAGLFTGNWSAMWAGIKQMFSGAVQFLWNAVQLLLWGKLLKGVAVFAGMFRGAVSGMWASIKSLFSSSLSSIRSTFTAGFNAIKSGVTSALNAIRSKFQSILSAITSRVSSALSAIRSRFTSGMSAARSAVTNALNSIRSFFASALANIVSRVASGLANIRSRFTSGMSAARSAVMSALNAIKSTFQSAISAIVSRVTSGLSRMVSAFRSGLERAKSIVRGAIQAIKGLFNIDLSAQGAKIVASVARGISGAIGKVTGAISKVTQKIRNFLPFSPAKEGALRDLDKLNFGGTMAKSITRQTGTVRRAMASVMEAARPNVDYAIDNPYSNAGGTFAAQRRDAVEARQFRSTIEVPVYLHGREIARASNDEQKRINAREQARVAQFNRTGGAQ